MRKIGLGFLLLLLAVPSYAQFPFSSKAIREFNNALTQGSIFGSPRYTTAALPLCDGSAGGLLNVGAIAYDTTANVPKFCTGSAWTLFGVSLSGTNLWTGKNTFNDGANGLVVASAADATKLLNFNLTGLTTGNTVTAFLGGSAAAPTWGTVGNPWTTTYPGTVLAADGGCASTPSLAFSSQAALGWCKGGTNLMQLTNPNNLGQLLIPSQVTPALNAATPGLTGSLGGGQTTGTYERTTTSWGWSISGTESMALLAGTLVLGVGAGSASPSLQVFQAQNALGTNIVGSDGQFAGGQSTGNALPGVARISRTTRVASGSSLQPYTDAIVPCGTKVLSNTSATLSTLAVISAATSATGGGAQAFLTVTATDGTQVDTDTQSMNFSWRNVSGTVVAVASAAIGDDPTGSSGSTTIGATVTVSGTNVQINVTPVFTTIVPTTVTGFVTVLNNSAGAVTCQ